ncbi:MCE family protein [Catellatospora chokoriensis]|uniref:ABC transporter substrate-binding protein n=1 Tax=Catellatospora chokoriensis TaxID=310353 RepID=A0A8J3NQQ0_9ACTN|nr:MCE family protein [Catellatospora chokoriensis]GIF89442.1 ABC transporter substrate-binding protein [Catellatospora chokoriensis]
MILTRLARLQLLVFALVGVLGVGYVAVRYVGVGDGLTGRYTVHADFAVAGGIFANASVTYRGVPVGRVDAVRLHGDGVRVDLRLDGGTRVPADLRAVVAHRSAVGEQYVDLRPETDAGPYLADGDVIPASRTGVPLPVETLLSNLDALVASVDPAELGVLVDELGTAFAGNESALRTLLDSGDALLTDANTYLPQTVALIQDSATVLETQARSADEIRRFAKALAQLSATVRAADPDLRRLLANGPPASAELLALLRDLDPSLGPLLGNLITVNGVAVRRLDGIEQILVTYPLVVAGGFTVAPGDGTAHLGLVLNVGDPPACNYTKSGQSLRCTGAELGRGSGVRSSTQAPRGGAPPSPAPLGAGAAPAGPGAGASPIAPAPGTTVAGFDPVTGLVIGPDGLPLQFGGTGGQAATAGEQSWKLLLLNGLAP